MSSPVSFGTNTNAQRKRVKFVNSDSSSSITIYEGQPMCYQFDTTTNILGVDRYDGSASTTTTDGYQNEGKFLIVDVPYGDNVEAFAGVVAKGSWCGQAVADGSSKWIEIYIPNGAIVPVRADQDCTEGRTILAVHTAEQALTAPHSSNARPVAIAWESYTRSASSPGLVLAKLDPSPFVWQHGDDAALLIDDEDSGNDVTINKINISSSLTTGSCCGLCFIVNTVNTDGGSAMYWEYGNTGTGAGGMKLVNAYVEAAGTAIAADVVGMKMQVNLLADAGTTTASTAMAIFAKTEVKSGAGTIAGDVFAGRFCLGLGANPTGTTAQLQFEHTGGNYVDYFFEAVHAASIAYTADTTGTNQAGAIKIQIAGVDHYLHTFSATAGAT